jgi:NADPH:quinone reductase-like Zn-dependent oxidoreductase
MIPETMRAAVLHEFAGPAGFAIEEIPVPTVGPTDVLVRVHTAGVGVWDPYEASGGFRSMSKQTGFPYVPGSDASGEVVAVGDEVERCGVGDAVYASTFLNPNGGSFAEYVSVPEEEIAHVPEGIDMRQAGVLGCDGITAMSGLKRPLELHDGQTLLVFGASGGIGHIAVQLAKRMGASVFAVASGEDGVGLMQRLGTDGSADGHADDAVQAARDFAPDGYDAALLTAGGRPAAELVKLVRDGGRVAWPYGVQTVPELPPGVSGTGYDGYGKGALLDEINALIEAGPFTVHVDRVFPLSEVKDALDALSEHFLGKLAIRVSE